MSNIRFFQCKECGLMAASLNDKVIPNLNELIPNTVEASGEKTAFMASFDHLRQAGEVLTLEDIMVRTERRGYDESAFV